MYELTKRSFLEDNMPVKLSYQSMGIETFNKNGIEILFYGNELCEISVLDAQLECLIPISRCNGPDDNLCYRITNEALALVNKWINDDSIESIKVDMQELLPNRIAYLTDMRTALEQGDLEKTSLIRAGYGIDDDIEWVDDTLEKLRNLAEELNINVDLNHQYSDDTLDGKIQNFNKCEQQTQDVKQHNKTIGIDR